MMKWVLIQHGRVHEVYPERPGFHEELVVVEVPDGVEVGHVRDGDSFAPYMPPPITETGAARRTLIESDRAMARVAEDIIDTLVNKGLVAMTDLPPAARNLVAARKAARRTLAG